MPSLQGRQLENAGSLKSCGRNSSKLLSTRSACRVSALSKLLSGTITTVLQAQISSSLQPDGSLLACLVHHMHAYILAALPAVTPAGASSNTRQLSAAAAGSKEEAAFRKMSGAGLELVTISPAMRPMMLRRLLL